MMAKTPLPRCRDGSVRSVADEADVACRPGHAGAYGGEACAPGTGLLRCESERGGTSDTPKSKARTTSPPRGSTLRCARIWDAAQFSCSVGLGGRSVITGRNDALPFLAVACCDPSSCKECPSRDVPPLPVVGGKPGVGALYPSTHWSKAVSAERRIAAALSLCHAPINQEAACRAG
jgi:hypothetical protein